MISCQKHLYMEPWLFLLSIDLYIAIKCISCLCGLQCSRRSCDFVVNYCITLKRKFKISSGVVDDNAVQGLDRGRSWEGAILELELWCEGIWGREVNKMILRTRLRLLCYLATVVNLFKMLFGKKNILCFKALGSLRYFFHNRLINYLTAIWSFRFRVEGF